MEKLFLGTLLLASAIVVPIPTMAEVNIGLGISLPPPATAFAFLTLPFPLSCSTFFISAPFLMFVSCWKLHHFRSHYFKFQLRVAFILHGIILCDTEEGFNAW
jgi:hypothetical protein